MSGITGYSRHKFLEEITVPLDHNGLGDFITPAAQRLAFLKNLSGSDSATVANFVGAVTGVAPAGTGGTAGTDVTAVEYGDAAMHSTVLTFSSLVIGAVGDSSNIARGVLIYTLPAGIIRVRNAAWSIGLTLSASATPTTDTPDLGLGTVIAAGAVATLDGTGTFEDIMTGQTINDVAGTVEVTTVTTQLMIPAASAHTIHLNVADGWADITPNNPNVLATGTIWLEWDRLTTS